MTETQKILFEQALTRLKGIEAKHENIRIIFSNVIKEDEWIIQGKEVVEDLRQCSYLFQTILNEVKGS